MKPTKLLCNVSIILCLLCQFASCSKSPDAPQQSRQPNELVQPKPFKGEVYRAPDNTQAITLVSPDELEMSVQGSNFVCKYTKQGDTLRVVANIMGSTQALYYRITDEGLRGNDGSMLYTPSRLEEVRRAADAARHKAQLNASLGEACLRANLPAVKALLDQGADIDTQFQFNKTPLKNAMDGAHMRDESKQEDTTRIEIVKLLLAKGADPNLQSPLFSAAETHFGDYYHGGLTNLIMMKMLLQGGADIRRAFAAANGVSLFKYCISTWIHPKENFGLKVDQAAKQVVTLLDATGADYAYKER